METKGEIRTPSSDEEWKKLYKEWNRARERCASDIALFGNRFVDVGTLLAAKCFSHKMRARNTNTQFKDSPNRWEQRMNARTEYIHLVRANTKANEAHPSDRCYDMNWNKKYHSSYSIQINKCMGKIYSDAIRSTIKGYVYEDMQQIIYHNGSFVVSLLSIRRCLFASVSYFYTCLLFVLAKKTIVTLTEQMTHAHEKK